jgi:L-alanine-DL-glutamate epimerase-like enolase superfamily enzyme
MYNYFLVKQRVFVCVENQRRAGRQSQVQITSIHAVECALPLPRPIVLGTTRIETRDIVVLAIGTTDGLTGVAIGYTRGSPLLEALNRLGPRLIGKDAWQRRAIINQLESSAFPARAQMSRAYSLIDIALWDLACKHAKMPLHAMLGTFREAVPATAVAGYFVQSRSVDHIRAEVKRRFDDGFVRVKTMINGLDDAADLKLCTAVARDGGRQAVDAHWSWQNLSQAKPLCNKLDGLGFEFIEDPFPAGEWQAAHKLQLTLATPIAAGEDVYGLSALAHLSNCIGLLRVDATTCGGITTALEAIAVAAANGRQVFPHVFPSLHVHLACACPFIETVEFIPAETEADPLHLILRNEPKLEDGLVKPSTRPGVGFDIDFEAAARFKRGNFTHLA